MMMMGHLRFDGAWLTLPDRGWHADHVHTGQVEAVAAGSTVNEFTSLLASPTDYILKSPVKIPSREDQILTSDGYSILMTESASTTPSIF